MRSATLWLLGLSSWSALTAVAPAAVVELRPVASSVVNPDNLTEVDPSFIVAPGKLRPRDQPYLIGVNVALRIVDLDADQLGFANTAFNVAIGGDGTKADLSPFGLNAWLPNVSFVDSNGVCDPVCPINLFEINSDDGQNGDDLQAIILAVATRGLGPIETDPRYQVGKSPEGDVVGTFFIELPGTPGATAYAETLTPWGASTFDATGLASTAGNSAIGGLTTTFMVVPEPSAAMLLLIAAGALGYLRGRFTTAR